MNIGYSSPLPPVFGVIIAAPITPMRTPFPDLSTAQGFAAHKGEITCMVAGPGGKYVVTGGVDFQVKVREGGLE